MNVEIVPVSSPGPQVAPTVLFAMRYANNVGFVWDSMSRLYDAAAGLLDPQIRALVAYPELLPDPTFHPRVLRPVARDFYRMEPAQLDCLAELVTRENVRVIFYMGAAATEINLPFLRRLGVRTICYEQDSFPPNARQGFVRKAAKWFLRSVLHVNLHDAYLANAEHQRQFLLSFACLPPGRVQTVVNGVDTTLFRPGPAPDPAALGLPVTQHYALTVCQARTEKRVDFLLGAAAELFRRRPDASLTFVHVGDGPCLPEWRDRACALGLEGRFCFVGYQNDVAPFHRLSDFLIHAADRESFGFVIAEAMATGKPVVATESPGPREIITDGKTGYVLPQDDVPGFATAMLRLADNAQLRQQMGAAALEKARRDYSLSRQSARLAEIIRCEMAKAIPHRRGAPAP